MLSLEQIPTRGSVGRSSLVPTVGMSTPSHVPEICTGTRSAPRGLEPKDTPPAVCPVCQKQFKARRSLPRHVRTQHPDYDGPLTYDPPEEQEEQEEQEQEEDQD